MIKYLGPILTTTALCCIPNIVCAQTYTPSNRTPQADNSIGTTVTNAGANNFNITGGLQRGQNLFHSFSDFSIPTGGAANFTNPAGNQSIITRVTGNLFSDLNGTLNTNGANFLLINPNGVVFGSGIKLDVGKAFVTSTASGVDFVDAQGRNYNFGTNKAGDAPLISIDPNVAFNPARLIIGGSRSKGIENYGALETQHPNQYIGLIGGNITFNGGQINAPGGRVELGGLATPGTVGLGGDGNNLRVQFPTNVVRGDVSLTNQSKVVVAGAGDGDIVITARNLEILGESEFRGGIEEGLGTPASVAGDIKVNATGEIAIVGSKTGIRNNVGLNSKGNGGNITIDAGFVSFRDNAQLQAVTFGTGNAGNVNVTAKGTVSLVNASFFSTVEDGGVGKGGYINIDAGSLSLQDSAQLATITRGASATQPAGKGDAGNIKVKVSGAVDIAGTKDGLSSGILSLVDTGTVGNGGNINIDAGSFSLRDGALLSASTYGTGNAGNVTVMAKDAVSLVNANIFSTVAAGGVGKGGNISIDAGSLSLRDGSQLRTITSRASDPLPAGIGDAGNIKVKVSGAIDIAGTKDGVLSGMNSSVQPGAVGKVGNITIDAGSLSLQDSSFIGAANLGQGNAGDINIKTQGNITISGTNDPQAILSDPNDPRAFINTNSDGQSNAGKISIETPGKLSILNRGYISSAITNTASGDSQGISIKAGEVELNNYSSIVAFTSGRGNGGDIDIKTIGDLTISGKSSIITNTYNSGTNQFQGNAGNISLDVGNFKLIDSSIFSSTSRTGNAGNIGIQARGDIALAGTATFVNNQPTNISKSVISSSSLGVGDAGKISIYNPSGKLSLSFSSITTTIGGLENKNATGISQGISINARELEIKNNSLIISELFDKGQAGNIDIKTTGDITISGNNKDFLKAIPFNLSGISSTTHGIGDGGKISIETPGKLSLDSTGLILSAVDKDAQGTSQGIKIKVGELNLTDFGNIGSDTLGKNPGGDIEIIAKGAINIKNSTIQANSIKFTTTLNVPGSNDLLASSTGEGKAGNISISSDRLNLNSGYIISIATSGDGGNITLNLSDKLLLRNNSAISTSSGEDFGKDFGGSTGGGDGGNITINSPLIIALPAGNFGNDITANAFTGKGGKINITSQGLFGIQYRPKGSDFTNDITASSTFGLSGSVQINTPGTDPGRDSTELPNTTTDASNQISQVCSASNRQNKLTVTGRGGLPPNANDPLTSDVVWQDARAASSQPAVNSAPTPAKLSPPAVGWVFDGKGKVTLIAAGTAGQPTGTSVMCPNVGEK